MENAAIFTKMLSIGSLGLCTQGNFTKREEFRDQKASGTAKTASVVGHFRSATEATNAEIQVSPMLKRRRRD